MLKLRKIKPIGSQVLVTENVYDWDDFNDMGLIIHKRGDLKTYQKVLAVGDDVKFVKPEDTVEINLYKYCEFADDPTSVKVNGTNKVVKIHLNEVSLEDSKGNSIPAFLIDQRDVKYILEDFEEAAYENKSKLVQVEQPKTKLILPDNKIKV